MARLSIPEPNKVVIKFDKGNSITLREPLGEDMIKLEGYTKDSESQTEALLKTIILLQDVPEGEDPLLLSEVKRFPSGWINHIGEKLGDLQSKPKS